MNNEKEFPSYYSIIPADVRYDKRLNFGARLLYSEITALSNKNGFCWASNQYFAELYDVSKNTISLWIKSLIEYGYTKTEIVYKYQSKEIDSRKIILLLSNNDTLPQKINTGYDNVSSVPITKINEVNSTSINNTRGNINTSSDDANKEDIKFNEILNTWNLFAEENNLSKIDKITETRKNKYKTRIKEGFILEEIIDKIKNSKFMLGTNERKWKVTFGWMIENDTNWVKIMEDMYSNNNSVDLFGNSKYNIDSEVEQMKKRNEVYNE